MLFHGKTRNGSGKQRDKAVPLHGFFQILFRANRKIERHRYCHR